MFLAGCMSPSEAKSNQPQSAADKSEDMSQTTEDTEQTTEIETDISSGDIEIIKDKREGIVPATIEIPAIDIKTKVEHVGTLPDGRMGVPDDSDHVAWFKSGTKPGAPGNAVIDGHVDDLVSPAVFYNLHKLEKGDKVLVTGEDGTTLTFEVYDKKVFPRQDAPLKDIFGFTYMSALNLITCTGEYNPDTTERAERLVVYSKLVQNK